MAQTLNMIFTKGTSTKSVSLSDHKEGLTKAQVHGVMQKIIDHKALGTDTEAVDGIKNAYLKDIEVHELAM